MSEFNLDSGALGGRYEGKVGYGEQENMCGCGGDEVETVFAK